MIVPMSARAPTAHAMPTPAFAPLLRPPLDVDFDTAASVDVDVELARAAVAGDFVVDVPVVVVAELEESVLEAAAVVLLLSESVVFDEESDVEELLSEVVVEVASAEVLCDAATRTMNPGLARSSVEASYFWSLAWALNRSTHLAVRARSSLEILIGQLYDPSVVKLRFSILCYCYFW